MDTTKSAAGMTIFDPNDTWSRYEEPEANQEETDTDKPSPGEDVAEED